MDVFTTLSPTDYFYAGCNRVVLVDRHHTTRFFRLASAVIQKNGALLRVFVVFVA
jgi:hypothetical protein